MRQRMFSAGIALVALVLAASPASAESLYLLSIDAPGRLSNGNTTVTIPVTYDCQGAGDVFRLGVEIHQPSGRQVAAGSGAMELEIVCADGQPLVESIEVTADYLPFKTGPATVKLSSLGISGSVLDPHPYDTEPLVQMVRLKR